MLLLLAHIPNTEWSKALGEFLEMYNPVVFCLSLPGVLAHTIKQSAGTFSKAYQGI